MAEPKKEWKIVRFARAVARFFRSRIGVAITGTVSLACIGLAAVLLTLVIRINTDPLSFAPTSVARMYDQAIKDPDPAFVDFGRNKNSRSTTYHGYSQEFENRTYYYVVPEDKRFADSIEVTSCYVKDKVGYAITLSTVAMDDYLFMAPHTPLLLTVSFYDPETNDYFLLKGNPATNYFVSEPHDLGALVPLMDNTWVPEGFTQEEFEGYKTAARTDARAFLAHAPEILHVLTGEDGQSFLEDMKRMPRISESAVGYSGFLIFIAAIGTPLFAIFIGTWIALLIEDTRFKLVSQGKLERYATTKAKALTGENDEAEEEKPTETPKMRSEAWIHHSKRVAMMEDFITRHRIRPCLGEWVFRGLGLGLMVLGSVLATLVTIAVGRGWASPFWDGFVAGGSYYNSISSLGSFVLVIAVIIIISESRRNLALSAAVFFGLSLTFYTVMSSFFLFVDTLLGMKVMSFSSFIAQNTSGNIFLSLGIFAFIGFFLFADPPKYFINRKVFRLLSLIPTSLAIVSVIFSYLYKAYGLQLQYWESSFLFVRNFDGLLIGIILEFAIFGFRTYLKRAYGADQIDEQMSRPIIQFGKNCVLSFLIVLFVIVFYALPLDVRTKMNMGQHTFIYLMIPLFLFLKPAGKDHKGSSDIIYYVLYIFCMTVPNLTSPIVDLISMIGH